MGRVIKIDNGLGKNFKLSGEMFDYLTDINKKEVSSIVLDLSRLNRDFIERLRTELTRESFNDKEYTAYGIKYLFFFDILFALLGVMFFFFILFFGMNRDLFAFMHSDLLILMSLLLFSAIFMMVLQKYYSEKRFNKKLKRRFGVDKVFMVSVLYRNNKGDIKSANKEMLEDFLVEFYNKDVNEFLKKNTYISVAGVAMKKATEIYNKNNIPVIEKENVEKRVKSNAIDIDIDIAHS